MRKGTGTHETTFSHEDGREATVTIEYSWYYAPGRMYLSNGDPGYPDESEIEITDWHDEEGNQPEWIDDDMVYKALDEANIDFWEEEDEGPDPDDYYDRYREERDNE